MSKLSTELGRSSLHGFNQAVVSNGWKAPFIPSQWYVGLEALPEAKIRCEKARAFGQDIARCLDAWANHLAYESNTVHNLEMTTDLLDLADWVASMPGYGNFQLASRSQDIASVGICRMIADLGGPFLSVSNLFARLDAPWRSPKARAAILNLEARTRLFPINATDKELNAVWENGEKLVLKHSSPAAKAAFEGKDIPVETPEVMEHLDFFKDDPVSSRRNTLLRSWDMKSHYRLVIEVESRNKKRLQNLLTFRQKVGCFPERPQFNRTPEQEAKDKLVDDLLTKGGNKITPFEKMYSSPGEAAFVLAWKRYETKDTPYVGHSAWNAYKDITSCAFYDEDTQQLRFESEVKVLSEKLLSKDVSAVTNEIHSIDLKTVSKKSASSPKSRIFGCYRSVIFVIGVIAVLVGLIRFRKK
jgi:hypothetical protein